MQVAGTSPASCEELSVEARAVFQELLDVIEGQTMVEVESFAEMTPDEEQRYEAIQVRFDTLEASAADQGCGATSDEQTRLVACPIVGDLRASGEAAESVLRDMEAVCQAPLESADLPADELEWAEEATLRVAEVNDIVALRLVVVLAGAEGDGYDWEELGSACADLRDALPAVVTTASNAPARFAVAASHLESYSEQVGVFATGCVAAALDDDPLAFDRLDHEVLFAASDELDRFSELLPADAQCAPSAEVPVSCG